VCLGKTSGIRAQLNTRPLLSCLPTTIAAKAKAALQSLIIIIEKSNKEMKGQEKPKR